MPGLSTDVMDREDQEKTGRNFDRDSQKYEQLDLENV